MRVSMTTKTFSGRERGSTLFIVAGSLTVLLGIGALAVDIGALVTWLRRR